MKKALLYLEAAVVLFNSIYLIHVINKYQIAGMFSTSNRAWAISYLAMYVIKVVFIIVVIEIIRRIMVLYTRK